MTDKTPLGWVVTVHATEGALLYAVREPIAFKAEDKLRNALKLSPEIDVSAFRPIEPSLFESFQMALIPIRGPF